MNHLKKNFFYFLVLSFLSINTTYIYCSEKPTIFVSISPQKYIIDKITAGEAEVHALLGSNQNPHTFEPTPAVITKLCESDVYFTTGIPFEKNILKKLKSINKNILIEDTSSGIEKLSIDNHAHGTHDRHNHESEPDPHIWLSIPLLVKQIDAITAALSKLYPEKTAYFRLNSDKLTSELSQVHNLIKEDLAPYKGKTFYIYHPSLGYFADEYGLEQIAVEAGGKKPTAKQISNLAAKVKTDNINTIFAQPQFDKNYITAVANAINCDVEIIDPLEYNVLQNIINIADKLKKSFKKTN